MILVFFSPNFVNFKSKTTPDWLNHSILPSSSCVTFKFRKSVRIKLRTFLRMVDEYGPWNHQVSNSKPLSEIHVGPIHWLKTPDLFHLVKKASTNKMADKVRFIGSCRIRSYNCCLRAKMHRNRCKLASFSGNVDRILCQSYKALRH